MQQFNNKTILPGQKGFTLMEIMVATVIFAFLMVSLMGLFNYVLKINRRGEALRQAAQDSQNFVEFLVKEIRNGQVDYFVNSGAYTSYINADIPQAPCRPPGIPGTSVGSQPTYKPVSGGLAISNWLGIINTDNVEECFYFASSTGAYVDTIGSSPSTFTAPASSNAALYMEKDGVTTVQKLNPPNSRIEDLAFVVRPQNDPYSSSTGFSLPKIQPVVKIIIKFVVQLPTGEQVPMYYQTSVSENKYDIPNQ
jgi:prepilin-type N-terminal cleavage/methylation domain-containing protein